MTVEEHIAGEVQLYDFTQAAWVTAAVLSDANVKSVSTKRQCCADGAFEIGGVYSAVISIVCRLPGMTRHQIRGAKISIRTWYGSDSSAAEPMGTFWVTDARKTDDIFTISGQCGIGWADTSSYNELSDDAAKTLALTIARDGAGGSLQHLMGESRGTAVNGVTGIVNDLVQAQTGIPGMIRWEDTAEEYANQWIYARNADGSWYKTSYPAYFSVYSQTGTASTDCPRDYYRWLAQLAGGFITSGRNGALTLRQFGMPGLGTAELHTADMETDSCEIADYTMQLYRVSVSPEVDGVTGMSVYTTPDYAHRVPIRYLIESNPVLDGFCKRWIVDEGSVPDVWTIAHNLWWSFYYHYNDAGGGIQIRPFRVKTHKPCRYELGQNIMLYFKERSEDTETAYQSVITSVQWTLHGGYVLSCGGEDSRVMADCVRATKADKAIRELRSRYQALSGR